MNMYRRNLIGGDKFLRKYSPFYMGITNILRVELTTYQQLFLKECISGLGSVLDL